MAKQLPLPLSEPLLCRQCGKTYTVNFEVKKRLYELNFICPECHRKNIELFIQELREGKQ